MFRSWKKRRIHIDDFCNAAIRAESEMNPDHDDNPDNNYSFLEFAKSWIEPHPLHLGRIIVYMRHFMDNYGRPDYYVIREFKRQVAEWNKETKHQNIRLGIYRSLVTEITPATKRRPEIKKEVYHYYLRIIRGKQFVRQREEQINITMEGLEESKTRDQNCINVRLVDKAIEETLREQENGI
jgi:hypothetical protein